MKTADSYDPFLYALALWRESRGESLLAKVYVAWVIRNRMTDAQKRWPTRPGETVLQSHQFSSFSAGDPNAVKFPVSNDPSWIECCRVVDAVAAAAPENDPSKGSNFYHSYPEAQKNLWPSWAEASKQTAIVGSFHFYKR